MHDEDKTMINQRKPLALALQVSEVQVSDIRTSSISAWVIWQTTMLAGFPGPPRLPLSQSMAQLRGDQVLLSHLRLRGQRRAKKMGWGWSM